MESSIIIKEVLDKKALKTFIDFPNQLYKGNPYFVPKLAIDEYSTLNPKDNPAFNFCRAKYFLAYKDNKVVGRVAAIINDKANQAWDHKEVRYGWLDFIDDREVSKALIDKVIEFGKQYNMEQIAGPLGFTDFDPEGMLVEGYDKMCTMVLTYNHPYYKEHFEDMGFKKEVDWVEYNISLDSKISDKIPRVAKLVREKYKLKSKKFTKRDLKKYLGREIFDLINISYSKLYNFTVLPPELCDKYVGFYLNFIDPDFISVIENEEKEIVGVGIIVPSIVKALQKTKGKLFPFGWFHLLKSLYWKYEGAVELLLVAVSPKYQSKGVLSLIFEELIPQCEKRGLKFGETNANLENNHSVQHLWEYFNRKLVKRRRIYAKKL